MSSSLTFSSFIIFFDFKLLVFIKNTNTTFFLFFSFLTSFFSSIFFLLKKDLFFYQLFVKFIWKLLYIIFLYFQ
ncbi:hypothetical protein STCU_10472 [Strigomonas culicis]|uniref:Uncharacterized protein n=1 Tax=Strigomonas culicis TaxID=28005 RepID=S9UT00_9TRYP|nr:hypothetical protein STCU_10472 [Strigomonas culicis]|eukprot:EPY17671.1 hypothetical protein STCU_10472 [Strigomonas culicis]